MTTHPEDQTNQTLLIAKKREDQVDMSWPDDLALARYVWRKLGTSLAEAEFKGPTYAIADDMLGAEIKGAFIEFFGPQDLPLAKWLYARLGDALDDKEWEAYGQVRKLQSNLMKASKNGDGVEIQDARALKSLPRRIR